MATRGRFTLIGPDGAPYVSERAGTLGGHRRTKVYGRLDCPSALRWIARGHYVRHRVFFADAATARAAGYRACRVCHPPQDAGRPPGVEDPERPPIPMGCTPTSSTRKS